MAEAASQTKLVSFASIVSAPPSGRARALVIDHGAYARAVILQGKPIPWDDPIVYAQFLGRAQGLLRPDTTLLDLGAFYAHALANDPELTASLAARPRVGYALKTLLGESKLAERAVELATVVARTSRAPLVVAIPSPLVWLAQTHVLAGVGAASDLTSEHAENAAMYVADWLRRFAALPLALVLLDDRPADDLALCEVDETTLAPVRNIAEHYRWALGSRTAAEVEIIGSPLRATAVPADYWLEAGMLSSDGDFLIADIPERALPETVLEQLAKLA